MIARLHIAVWQNITSGLPYSVKREKTGQFFHREDSIFLKKIMFKNLFGPKELILYVQQWLSQNLMDSSKVLPEVCHNR